MRLTSRIDQFSSPVMHYGATIHETCNLPRLFASVTRQYLSGIIHDAYHLIDNQKSAQ